MAEQTKKQCFIDKCKKQEYEGRSNCNGMCSQHFKENWGTIPNKTNEPKSRKRCCIYECTK